MLLGTSFVSAKEIGSVAMVINNVFTKGLNHRVEKGVILYSNEKIITGTDSAVNIKFSDGSSLLVGEESRAILSEFNYDTVSHKVVGAFNFLTGIMRFETGSIPMVFRINTPHTEIKLKGTSFDVFASKTSTEIFCNEGTLEVAHKEGKKELNSGESLSVDRAGKLEFQLKSTSEMAERISQMLVMLDQIVVLDKKGSIKQLDKISEVNNLEMKSEPESKHLEINLVNGLVKIRLRPDLAPIHVSRIKQLTKSGFY